MERRRFPRVTACLPARYWLSSQSPSESRPVLMEDISEGGARLSTTEPLMIGQKIRFVFDGNQSRQSLSELSGMVAWQENIVDYSNGDSRDTGITFVPNDPITKNRIKQWLLKREVVPRPQLDEAEPSTRIESAYDSSTVTFKVLRAFGWGPLINLGYFRFPSPLSALNLLYNFAFLKTANMLPRAQVRLARKSFEFLDIQAEDDVLDIACGRGYGSFMMACSYPKSRVTGIDLLTNHIRVASALYGNVGNLRFKYGDALSLPFESVSFDKVLCLEAAFHFADRGRFLKEAYRVLKEDGRLVVVDFAWKTEEDRRILEDEPTRFVRREWQWDDFFSVGEYLRSATSVGFEVEGCHKWGRKVTGPIQCIFNTIGEAGRWSWSRTVIHRSNPLLYSLTDNDWANLRYSARAHNYVRRHVEYLVLVLKKTSGK